MTAIAESASILPWTSRHNSPFDRRSHTVSCIASQIETNKQTPNRCQTTRCISSEFQAGRRVQANGKHGTLQHVSLVSRKSNFTEIINACKSSRGIKVQHQQLNIVRSCNSTDEGHHPCHLHVDKKFHECFPATENDSRDPRRTEFELLALKRSKRAVLVSACVLVAATAFLPHSEKSSISEAIELKEESNRKPAFQESENGVSVLDILNGNGPVPKDGDLVAIHYYGRLAAKQGWRFDSTYDHKDADGAPQPFEFIVGSPSVIGGLNIAVKGMKVGGTRRAIIPPNQGYQSTSDEPIPPNFFDRQRLFTTIFNPTRIQNGEGSTLGTLVFDIQLLGIRRPA